MSNPRYRCLNHDCSYYYWLAFYAKDEPEIKECKCGTTYTQLLEEDDVVNIMLKS